jgi:hypothetical protein
VNELTRALYEAHVAHELAGARPSTFDTNVAVLTEQTFEWLAQVKLDDILTRERVLGVIERYVIDLRISGGITELAGQLALTVFTSDVVAETRVDQLLSDASFAEYADKIESLGDAHREVIRLITETPTFRALVSRGLTLAAVQLLVPSSAQDEAAPLPGLLAGLRHDLGVELSQQLEARLGRYFERNADRIVSLTAGLLSTLLGTEAVRSIADELWDDIGARRLSELFAFLSAADVEDFWVVSYETWLAFRKTPFFRATSSQVVDAIFRKYGGESVQSLLDDMGVSEAMIVHEVRTLFGPVLAHAHQTGLRELQVRQRLLRFYESDVVSQLLAPPRA